MRSAGKLVVAGAALAAVLVLAERPVAALAARWPAVQAVAALAALALLGGLVYFGVVFALFGRQWLDALRRRGRPAAAIAPEPE